MNMFTFHRSELYLLLLVAAHFTLLYVFDIKSLIAAFFIAGAVFFLLFERNLQKLIFLLTLISLSIQKGLREWYVVTSAAGSSGQDSGYSYYFGFTLALVGVFAVAVLRIFSKNQKIAVPKLHSPNKGDLVVLILFFLSATTSYFLVGDQTITFFGFIRLIQSVLLFVVAQHIFASEDQRKKLVLVVLAVLLVLGFVGSSQFLQQHTLGLFLEDAARLNQLSLFTTDGERLFRVPGLLGHSTFFASFLSMLLPISIGFLLSGWHKNEKASFFFFIVGLSLFLGGLALIGTFSRSGWLAAFLATAFFGIRLWRDDKAKGKFFVKTYAFVLAILAVFFGNDILARINSIGTVFSEGSGVVRLFLIESATKMIASAPLLGVGIHHFTRTLAQSHPLPTGFNLFPVHNTFLLLMSELGLPAALLFIVFLTGILWRSRPKMHTNWVDLGVWLGALSFCLNAQFHPLLNQDPSFDWFMVLLAYLSVL